MTQINLAGPRPTRKRNLHTAQTAGKKQRDQTMTTTKVTRKGTLHQTANTQPDKKPTTD